MVVLVTYASKHGATQGIAERIAEILKAAGQDVAIHPVKSAGDLAGCDAFVIGSAVYFGSWRKEATEFVRRNRATLASHPVWLFSSGPLGTATTNAEGQDLRQASEPKELSELREMVHPRDHRVFFGALDHHSFGLAERALWVLPASRSLLIEGDFRDETDIEHWVRGMATELAHVPLSTAASEEAHRESTAGAST